MSQIQEGISAQVLNASVHDVRYLTALLRGVNFSNRATISITKGGLIISVEEARTLLATAYIFSSVFDEYEYQPEAPPPQPSADSSSSANPPPATDVAFEIPLNTLIECLNIFGTAGTSNSNLNPSTKTRQWRKVGEEEDGDDQDELRGSGASRRRDGRGRGRGRGGGASGNGRIDQFFGAEKGTAMRVSYAGPGYPLTLLITEDSGGPTATCEITTFEPEPQLELPFEADQTVLKIILKSSWLRDALSELDPSCERLTIIANPPPASGRAPRASAQPRLRLKAVGTFGSTEMDYPSDKDVLEACDCPAPVGFSYKFAHIARASRALQTSTKTSMRIDRDGLLSLQFLMPSRGPQGGNTSDAFIEFRCLALDEDL
ncbi:hypothetical protein EW026_g5123 [Hermanssonia centrifuga]|uniref:Rad1 n=1 Tax=Hermanssonia centrifuga TaxID=98765 RepID=A0A4S4KF45_9APHY|nr:hypothetical protein EW026_g5123 [Hermanssonia centrifuga]